MTIADLHTHTTYSSDSVITPEELVQRARRLDIDIVCITDHNIFEESIGIEILNIKNKKPLIIRGVELATDNGELLIYGLKKNFWKEIISDMRVLPSAKEVISAVKGFNGVCIWAHPFRKHNVLHYNVDYKRFKDVFIIESLNGHNNEAENNMAYDYAKENNFKVTGGSDAHSVSQIGRNLTLFKDAIQTEEEFLQALKSSEYKPITFEEFKRKAPRF